MDTSKDEIAVMWLIRLFGGEDGPIEPDDLTHEQLREFLWWILIPENYQAFRECVQFEQKLRRLGAEGADPHDPTS